MESLRKLPRTNHERKPMKTVKIFTAAILSFILGGCYIISNHPDIAIKSSFDGDGIAVLNFSSEGSYQSDDIGKISADKLTDALFLEGKFNVIDRSNVNNAQASLQITNTEELSSDQIQKLGDKLKAKYIILGRIRKVSDSEYFDPDAASKLYVSIRIISVKNSEVVGIASYSSSCSSNEINVIQEIMNKIVDNMEKS
jgi:TolB-like protein